MNKKQNHKVLTLNDDRPLRIKPCVVTTVPTGVWRYTFIDHPRNRSHREIFLHLSATLVPTRTYIILCKLFERRLQVDSTMINTSYNSRISKVRGEGYLELFHKLLKNKKREQKKVIKAVTSKEIMSQKKMNKRKQSASDKEYSKNDSPQPVAMVMET